MYVRILIIFFALLVSSRVLAERPPNIVIIFTDDLGYGDLSSYGHPTIRTPHLDRMAAEGIRFTDFYSAASVCTPSRAALLTGRLPVRNGMSSDRRRVLFPDSRGGIPAEELTLGEALRQQGYATAAIGKWHLGHLPAYLPTHNGFDMYFGIPYSNDMDRDPSSPRGREAFWNPKIEYWNVPLMRDLEIIERPADQTTITRRYAEEAVRFIHSNRDRPFFVYLAHSLPHVPLFRSPQFEKVSRRGLYGDVIEEIDWTVGLVLDALREMSLDRNTVVWFTSDNGPWLVFNDHGGSAGLLREGKGSTWEGGMRVPGIVWSGNSALVKGGRVVGDIASTLDIYTTSVSMAGGALPTDRVVDGLDFTPLLRGSAPGPRDRMFFYRGRRLFAVRKGLFKAHFITRSAYGPDAPEEHTPPLLYHLGVDPGEQWNVAPDHPEVLAEIQRIVKEHQANLEMPPSQLENENFP